MLKAQMHAHCKDDPIDSWINYSAEELLEKASSLGFDVFSITLHKKFYFPEQYKKAAIKHNMLLIPGVELCLDGKDVLVYNITKKEADSMEKLSDLKKIKRKDTLIVAPHPYVPFKSECLKEKLEEYHTCFDAIEYTYFYIPLYKYWNKKAEQAAKKYNLALVGNSDIHRLWQLDYTYTLIDAKKTVESVISAIKQKKTKVITKPIPLWRFIQIPVFGKLGR